jgi:hypothetical protein
MAKYRIAKTFKGTRKMSREQLREKTVNEGCPSAETGTPVTRACSLPVRRQILHLSSVYQRSSGYYREALRPVIRTLLDRMEVTHADRS